MKKNYWMAGAVMCVLIMTATGCNNEEINGDNPTGKGQRFTVTASTPTDGADTRVDYNETASKVELSWEANDAIGVWKAGETTVNEFTTATAGGSAEFASTESVSFADGDQLYTVYPKPTAVTADNKATLDLSAPQAGVLNKNIQYMYAAAPAESNTADFSFKHAVSVIKLSLDFSGVTPTPASLTSITLMANGLHSKATLDMADATPTVTGTEVGNITASGTFQVGNAIYLYLFPEALSDIMITATDGNTLYKATLANKTLTAGKVYTATITMSAIKFSNEGTSGIDGSTPEKAYTIANAEQLLLLATRANGSKGYQWNAKHYKLIDDIDFTGKAFLPIGTSSSNFRGKFDGDNHTVSGININTTTDNQGFFSYVLNASIKNLNASGAIKGKGYVGGILGTGSGTTLENCSFSGTVEGTGISVGGIIGSLAGTDNFVIACRNSATVTAYFTCVGGVAATLMNCNIIGSYNTGTVAGSFPSGTATAGGVVGAIQNNSKVISCYNIGEITFSTKTTQESGKLVGNIFNSTADYLAYLTAGSLNPVGNGIAGTNVESAATVADLNTEAVCTLLNNGIKEWNTANADKSCNWHYEPSTTSPVIVVGAPQ